MSPEKLAEFDTEGMRIQIGLLQNSEEQMGEMYSALQNAVAKYNALPEKIYKFQSNSGKIKEVSARSLKEATEKVSKTFGAWLHIG